MECRGAVLQHEFRHIAGGVEKVVSSCENAL